MQRIGMGLVGPGFVGMHHVDAVRRLGFVDVVAVADVDEGLARQKAEALGVPTAYGSFEALAADPAVARGWNRARPARSTTCTAPTCRTGCSSRQISPGASSPRRRRELRRGRHRIALVRPRAARARPAHRGRPGGPHHGCVGASGAISTALAGPVMGWINDTYGARAVLPVWAILPAMLSVVFLLIYLADRARGGYRVERIDYRRQHARI